METYWHENGEDCVETDGEIFVTYTRGTAVALYQGDDPDEARDSLGWDAETWNRILMSDPE